MPLLNETGFRVFSQFEEDGLLLYIFSLIGMGKRRFVDVGSADGINSNCANLAVHWGWHGLFIDGDSTKIKNGQDFYSKSMDTLLFPPQFCNVLVNAENIDSLISKASFSGEIDLLSIDIDGNDYYIWEALKVVQPRLVIIETNVEFGLEPIRVSYKADYVYPGKHPNYHGASIKAMEQLAKQKGYRLIGANSYGFNTIWIRQDLAKEALPTVAVEKILEHPRNIERQKLFAPIKDWDYIRNGVVV